MPQIKGLVIDLARRGIRVRIGNGVRVGRCWDHIVDRVGAPLMAEGLMKHGKFDVHMLRYRHRYRFRFLERDQR